MNPLLFSLTLSQLSVCLSLSSNSKLLILVLVFVRKRSPHAPENLRLWSLSACQFPRGERGGVAGEGGEERAGKNERQHKQD